MNYRLTSGDVLLANGTKILIDKKKEIQEQHCEFTFWIINTPSQSDIDK